MDASPILVVEDDDLVRSFLTRALAGVAGDVESCATGRDALRVVDGRRFSVILLDGLLPDTHGIELAGKLIHHPNGARSGICFVSGSLRTSFPMRDGVSALPKPLRLRELHDAASLLLAWSRRRRVTAAASRIAALNVLGADLLVT